jgi:hypothetical protein
MKKRGKSVPIQTKKAYMEDRGTPPVIRNLSNRWRWVTCLTTRQLTTRWKSPIYLRTRWASEPVRTYRRRDRSLACTEIRNVSCPARSLANALTAPSRLLISLVLNRKWRQRFYPLIRSPDVSLGHKDVRDAAKFGVTGKKGLSTGGHVRRQTWHALNLT